jgi:hypothetical protein
MRTSHSVSLIASVLIALCVMLTSPAAPAIGAQGGGEGLPTADQILSKYEQALGGAAALGKVMTRTTTTRRVVDIGEPSDHILTRRSKRPMMSIMYHAALDGTFLNYTNGCDGKSGWQGADESGAPRTSPVSTGGICEQELYYYGYFVLDLARMKQNLQRLDVKMKVKLVPTAPGPWGELAGGQGPDLVPPGPRDTYLVLSVPARKPDPFAWLYFDVETGALLRRAEAGNGATPVPPGDNPRITDFIQYRAVGNGTRAPFQFVTIGADSRVRGIHLRIVDNEPIADSMFAKPKNVNREDKGL